MTAMSDGYRYPQGGESGYSHVQGGGNHSNGCYGGFANGLDAYWPPAGPVPTGHHLGTHYVLGGPAADPYSVMYGMAPAPTQLPYPPVPGTSTGGH